MIFFSFIVGFMKESISGRWGLCLGTVRLFSLSSFRFWFIYVSGVAGEGIFV
jgi:hypothetical protein